MYVSKKVSFFCLGSNGGLSSVSGNNNVYGTLGNSVSSSSSLYQQNQGQSMYHPNGLAQQSPYPPSNYSNHLQPSYSLSSSQSTGNIYGGGYTPSSSIIPPNDIQSSSSWSQYAAANLANSGNTTAYDPNMYYAPYYPNLVAQPYYQQQQQQQPASQSQAQIPIDQTISPSGLTTSSNGGLDKNYQHLSR
jgi:hypothetical protein